MTSQTRPSRIPTKRIRVGSTVMVWGWLGSALGMLGVFAALMTGIVTA